jgi:DNA-binding SARP family transcriptional activator/WD40 repeat protein
MTSITVLGPVAVGDEGQPLSPRDRVVLSVLVSRRDRTVPSDSLAEALWGDDPPASAAKVVQGCIARLRRRLGTGAIVTERRGYRLVVPAEEIDAGRFERLAQRSRELLALDEPDQAAYAAREALSLWRGTALSDLEDWEPGRGEAQRLTELRLQVEELHLGGLLASGHHAEALTEATLRVEEQPLRERRWALLARAQYQDGRQAHALATVRRAREVLAAELGLDPGEELVGLEQAILAQDPTLSVPLAGRADATCPWPGLASYDVEDADTFFGRDAELAQCLARLGRSRLLAVVGPSGSGKSSLVRAGVAARLRHEGRRVHIITPGPRPLDELPGTPGNRSATSVLVVDQCEEVFASTVPEPVREAFLAGLVAQTEQGVVVLTLRADRLGELAAYPQVARLVEDGLYLLKGISTDGLRQAIEGPARRAGLLLERGLADLLVREVEGEPGSLPLLAHALRETWERRHGSTLTVEGYRASGGIRGAVAQSAEQVYEAATPEQREALRELLLRMVQPGPGEDPVRTSVDRSTIGADPERVVLVEMLVRARLVTVEEDRLEIAHEALARAWPRLRSWLTEDVEGERIRHHLAAAAGAWEAMGRPESELYRGARLAAALEWRDDGSHRLTEAESAFLTAGEQAHDSRFARAEAEARRQRGLNQRLRLLVVGAVVLALVAAVFGTAARLQWREAQAAQEAAQQAQAAAQAEEQAARSQELAAAAIAVVEEDPSLARNLAVLSATQGAPPETRTRDALHRALVGDRVVSRLSMSRPPGRLWAVMDPGGDRVAMTAEHVYDPGTALEVRDARSGELEWEWVRPEKPEYASVVVAGAEYSPDGAVLAGGVLLSPYGAERIGPAPARAPGPPEGVVGVHLWDAESAEPLQVIDVGPCGGWPVALAGDTLLVRTLAVRPSAGLDEDEEAQFLQECRWRDGALATLLVDRTTGESRQVSITENLNLHLTVGHVLTDDGSLAVVPDLETWSAVLLDAETGAEVDRLDNALALDVDSTGTRLLTIDVRPFGNDLWRIVSVPELRTEQTYTGRSSWSSYGRFASDDATVWTTGTENALVQWDARTGIHLRSIPAAGNGAPTVVGTRVLVPRPETAGAVVLDTGPPADLWSVPSCGGSGGTDRLRVTDDLVVVGRECSDVPTGRLETRTTGGEATGSRDGVNWEGFEVSPDGQQAVGRTGSRDPDTRQVMVGPLTVIDLQSLRPVVELKGFCEHAGVTLLETIGGVDPAVEGCRRFPDPPFRFAAGAVAWSPDGRWIAAASEGVGVWNATTGELVTSVGGTGSAENGRWGLPSDVHFSSDSRQLLMTTVDRHLVPISTRTWEPGPASRLDVQSAHSAGLAGQAADGSLVVVSPMYQVAGSTTVMLLDPDSLQVRQRWTGPAEGSVQAAALSPDGRRLALARSEGMVTVWELATKTRIDTANPGLGRLDGVRWLDDSTLVVLSASGHLTTITTDTGELLTRARRLVTRGLTEAECASYGLTPCPSMAELRGSEPVVPEPLRGRYAVSWEAQELEGELRRRASRSFGELDQASQDRLKEQSQLAAGTYAVQLREWDYSITDEATGEVWCTGSVSVFGPEADRLVLAADGGQHCSDFRYAEVGWRLEGGDLVLPAEDYRGGDLDRILWTSKPLERLD